MEYLALLVIILWLAITFIYGTIRSRRVKGSVEEWFVAGRKLGLIVLWLSLGANIYSSYTFLGLPGLAAREGFRVLAILLYGMISYIIGFWLIPLLWRNAKKRNWLTIADAFQDLYKSRLMGAYVALTSALWSIPYIQLQLQGMGYIIEASSYGMLNRVWATVIAFLILALLVTIGGLVSVTSINALQGAVMLIAVWVLGIVSPLIAFGGYDKMFHILASNSDPRLKFHIVPSETDYIFLYTIIFAAPFAFWLWPNRVQNLFAARDEKTVKRNMVLTGIYQLSQIPAILVGLTAAALYLSGTLNMPLYKKEIADQSFMLVATTLYHPLLVGVIGAGALAASLSTAAAILHACGALFSRNIVFSENNPRLLLYARIFTFTIALLSLLLAIYMPGVLVYLLLVGYAGIIQLFPEYLLKLKKPGLIGTYTAIASSGAGMFTVLLVNILRKQFKYDILPGVYVGLIGLAVNLAVLAIIIMASKWKK